MDEEELLEYVTSNETSTSAVESVPASGTLQPTAVSTDAVDIPSTLTSK